MKKIMFYINTIGYGGAERVLILFKYDKICLQEVMNAYFTGYSFT